MTKNTLSNGSLHKIPRDMQDVLVFSKKLIDTWEDITPLARNEWICWVESAKKEDTRSRRIRIMSENLAAGKRRPCCWAGCIHR
ncbi:MAG: YdeI/OmpD-associated family protein [Candidatus Pacebacteria bacterium]|nr:YdeI/OmpD-associated family protein [Candidatus Paceibacterota bacterium]